MLIDPMLNPTPAKRLVAVATAAVGLGNRCLSQVLQWLVRLYQLTLSPFIGNQCRFHPTCSHYAMEALQRHGPWRGSWLAAKRLGRCQPFAEGGLDPVPQNTTKITTQIHTIPSRGLPSVSPHVEDSL